MPDEYSRSDAKATRSALFRLVEATLLTLDAAQRASDKALGCTT